ncbi:MAG TPA: hypothetical protein ENK31_08265, partial [Nannocystis exedens]|nr:hypothetical protein [Nannocystis exedens]
MTGPHVGSLLAFPLLFMAAAAPGYAASTAPELHETEPQKPARQELPHLLFICQKNADRAAVGRILGALRAELVDLPASVTAICGADPGSPPDRVEHAISLTDREGAFAAMWIERERDEFIAYYLDPTEGSLRTRRIEISPSETADLDSLAVITRSTLDALLRARAGRRSPLPRPYPPNVRQKTPQETPRKTPRKTEGPLPPLPSIRGQLRLLIGYTGNRYAPTVRWQSGLNLTASYLWPNGAFAGAAYLVTSPISLDPYPLGADDLIVGKIHRRPATLLGGYQRLWPVANDRIALGLEAEFGLTLDVMAARTPVVCIDESGDYCEVRHELTRVDPVLFNLGFAPRIRLLIEPTKAVLLYLGAGIDLL